MSSRVSHLVSLVLVTALAFALVGVFVWWRMSPKKPVLPQGAACPPVRTSIAVLALMENPTAKSYATFGPGAGVFTNVFAHAGLAAVTDEASPVDLVFVSGEPMRRAIDRAKERCATNGILAVHCDVRKTTFKAFQKELAALPGQWSWRLWFPGHWDCLVVARTEKCGAPGGRALPGGDGACVSGPRLADMMELLAREGLFVDLARAGIDSPAALFASYAGPRADVLPVFGWAQGEVVPECFVTKEIPSLDWIDCSGVDADIREPLLTEIRSMQVIRRLVLQGDMFAREGKQDAAMDAWTKAVKRHPNDSLILERICLLDVNAETFLKVGNFPMAAQCLETMVCLRPKDVATARRLARVFRQMGKKELAEAVSKRADELVKMRLSVDAAARRVQTDDNSSQTNAASRRVYGSTAK